MNIGTIILDHDIDTEKLTDAIKSGDDIGAVIRCHYEAERALRFVLDRLTEGRFSAKHSRWQFGTCLELARIIGVDKKWLAPIATLNSDRNALAHNGVGSLSEENVKRIFSQVKLIFPGLSDEHTVSTHFSGVSSERKLCECNIRERYVFLANMAIALFAAIPQIPRDGVK